VIGPVREAAIPMRATAAAQGRNKAAQIPQVLAEGSDTGYTAANGRDSRLGSVREQMRRMTTGTIAGVLLAAAAIMAGLYLEGGSLLQVVQPSAALIVLGGTLGALLVQFPVSLVRRATREAWRGFREGSASPRLRLEEIVRLGMQARKSGMVSLDAELASIGDPFFRKSLMLVIDGIHPREVRDVMELELLRVEEEDERVARVWEAAGGYAPTFGILGAVLGLIQVMQRLDNLSQIGGGIAVAFVATLYGVGAANLLLLPLAGKLRIQARDAQMLRETTLEGVLSIAEGASPRALREKLGAQTGERANAPVARIATR
jgi:chemotaxis protein MotA